MDKEAFHLAQKTGILKEILSNYREEKKALIEKNVKLFKQVLKQRAHLIEKLSQIEDVIPASPLSLLQQRHMNQIIHEIAKERESTNKFFPH